MNSFDRDKKIFLGLVGKLVLGPVAPCTSSGGPEQGCFLTPGQPFPGGWNCLSLFQMPPVSAREQLCQRHSGCYMAACDQHFPRACQAPELAFNCLVFTSSLWVSTLVSI